NTPISSVVTYAPRNLPEEARDEVDIELKTEHDIVVVGLLPNTLYTLTVSGRDKFGNEAVSQAYEFTTAADSRPPLIDNIKIDTTIASSDSGNDNTAQFIISWDTDEESTSQIEYGEGTVGPYTQKTSIESTLKYKHLVVVSNLRPSSVYHLKIVVTDEAGNVSESKNIIVISPQQNEDPLEIIVGSLGDIFSFL
ncbi:MAG: hypothetical protein KDD60_12585, partial [Bdellovibrionales bacterium]|nr:hypothetical protein [Bdellovibrionales bacterium]